MSRALLLHSWSRPSDLTLYYPIIKECQNFGAVLNWDHQTLSFSSTGSKIPAVHRVSDSNNTPRTDHCPSIPAHTQAFVAAVHSDAQSISVTLRERVDLKPMCEALVFAFTGCLPPEDCPVVVEPKICSPENISTDNSL